MVLLVFVRSTYRVMMDMYKYWSEYLRKRLGGVVEVKGLNLLMDEYLSL